jgi:hypothetical protein
MRTYQEDIHSDFGADNQGFNNLQRPHFASSAQK